MLDFDKYVTTLPYPSKVYPKYADQREKYEAEKAAYEVALGSYRVDVSRLTDQFRVDALADLGLAEHPAAIEAFDRAWDHYHCDGLVDVYYDLKGLASLMLPKG